MSRTRIVIATLATALSVAGCTTKGPREVVLTPKEENQAIEFLLRRFDLNRDGSIGCDDLNTARADLFAKIDTDRSGDLTAEEYRFAKFDDESFLFLELADVDDNESGRISLSEFQSVTHNSYARLDRNRDCVVDRAELLEVGKAEVRRLRDEQRRRRRNRKPSDIGRGDDVKLEDLDDPNGPPAR